MAPTSATEIANTIERSIANGEMAAGHQLAPVRSLAKQLAVAPGTVAAAYRRLRDRGLVVGKGRQGTRVAPQVSDITDAGPVIPSGMVDALNGTPDPALLPNLAQALVAAAAAEPTGYGGSLLVPELEVSGRTTFGADGIEAEHLTVTYGSMDAIERVLRAQGFRTGDRIGVEDPGHVPVHQVARSAGLELVALPVDEHGITPDGLQRALTRGLSAIVVTPRAQNPTGAAFTPERAAAIDAILAPHPSMMVIQDDHAGPISGAPWVPLTPPGPRWATIRSLGKSFGPDLRLALVAGDEQSVDRVTSALRNGPGWVSHILQRTAAIMLVDAATQERIAHAAATYRSRREYLVAALRTRGVTASAPSGFNVWIPVADEQAAVQAVGRAEYAIRAADQWRMVSGPAVRVTVASLGEADMDAIAEALGAHVGAAGRSHQL